MAVERIALPPPDRAGGMTLAEALVRRRSVRAFAAHPITRGALGLAAYPVGAFEDARVAQVMKLGRSEAPLYLVPVGAPKYPVGRER
jgi:nitroreductase